MSKMVNRPPVSKKLKSATGVYNSKSAIVPKIQNPPKIKNRPLPSVQNRPLASKILNRLLVSKIPNQPIEYKTKTGHYCVKNDYQALLSKMIHGLQNPKSTTSVHNDKTATSVQNSKPITSVQNLKSTTSVQNPKSKIQNRPLVFKMINWPLGSKIQN